ncbi:MAG: sulfatase-like hydrolase/transferase [Anaerolineales bacterium]
MDCLQHHSPPGTRSHTGCLSNSVYLGYNANIPFENGLLSEMLLQHGYSTYAIGKWHLTPVDQVSAAGPHDRWPLGCGFERHYGFLGGDTHQYYPELV